MVAGVTEELIWRALFPSLVAQLTGNVALSVIWSSVAFSLGHLRLGPMWAFVTLFVAIGLHAVVLNSPGGLLLAILTHCSYGVWLATPPRGANGLESRP